MMSLRGSAQRSIHAITSRRIMSCVSSPSIPKWWAYLDLNQGPRAYQARALTN